RHRALAGGAGGCRARARRRPPPRADRPVPQRRYRPGVGLTPAFRSRDRGLRPPIPRQEPVRSAPLAFPKVQIVFADGNARHELDGRVNSPAATVDDLARALDPARAERTLLVGGRPVDADLDLAEAGLHEGAEVCFGTHRAGAGGPLAAAGAHGPTGVAGSGAALELVVVSGLDAGRRFPLAAGTVVIGRGRESVV